MSKNAGNRSSLPPLRSFPKTDAQQILGQGDLPGALGLGSIHRQNSLRYVVGWHHGLDTEPLGNVRFKPPERERRDSGRYQAPRPSELQKAKSEEAKAKVLSSRLGEIFDVGNIVFFLGGDESRYLKNQVLRVTGG